MDKFARPSEAICYRVDIIGEDSIYHWTKEEAILMLWSHYMSEHAHNGDMDELIHDWEELVTEGSIEDYGTILENKIPCRNWFTPKGSSGIITKHDLN